MHKTIKGYPWSYAESAGIWIGHCDDLVLSAVGDTEIEMVEAAEEAMHLLATSIQDDEMKDQRVSDEEAWAWYAGQIGARGTYVTGTGQRLTNVHARSPECHLHGCAIHNPTDPHLDWPTHWRDDRGLMERICPHGIGHPDYNAINYIRRLRGDEVARAESVHGCDGCCGKP